MEEGPPDNLRKSCAADGDAPREAFEGELDAKYEFRRLLGKGGMGRVVLARHRQLDELVAVKLLHPGLDNSELLWRFRREARAGARIRSPHVAKVMDVGKLESGAPYIVMEYLDGEDLARWIATRGPLPPLVAVHLLLQALDAIAEAHDSGIVHRDIKPANLFLTRDREGRDFVKVLDFGLAKSEAGMDSNLSAVTEPGTLVGSPCYMPPEQLLDARNADARSDVWALGATLFELVVGQPPFQAPTMPQLYTAIVHGRIRRIRDLLPDCPEGIDAVVARCLARNPSGRYADARELRDALVTSIGADAVSHVQTLASTLPRASALPAAAPTSVTPIASSWSPDERLARFVRPGLLSRRSLAVVAVALLATSIGIGRARHFSAAATTLPAPAPAHRVPASPPAVPRTAAVQTAESPESLPAPPGRKPSAPDAPRRQKVSVDVEPRDPPNPVPPAAPPSIYDKYP